MGKAKRNSKTKTPVSHALISTVGAAKTYRWTYADGSTFDYTVTDGADGAAGASGGNNGSIVITADTILNASHKGKRLLCYDNRNIHIPAGLSTDFWCIIVNKGTGTITTSGDHTVSIEPLGKTNAVQYTEFAIVHDGAELYSLAGIFN